MQDMASDAVKLASKKWHVMTEDGFQLTGILNLWITNKLQLSQRNQPELLPNTLFLGVPVMLAHLLHVPPDTELNKTWNIRTYYVIKTYS